MNATTRLIAIVVGAVLLLAPLGLPPFAMTLLTEPATLKRMKWGHRPVTALAVSCTAGVAMTCLPF